MHLRDTAIFHTVSLRPMKWVYQVLLIRCFYTKVQYAALLEEEKLKVYMYIRGFNMNKSNFPLQLKVAKRNSRLKSKVVSEY